MYKYYEIALCDGELVIEESNRDSLLYEYETEDLRLEFLSELPKRIFTSKDLSEGQRIIIKGKIVVPKAVEKVIEYDLE